MSSKSIEHKIKQYSQRIIICDICSAKYQRQQQRRHFQTNKHKNHKNNILQNNILDKNNISFNNNDVLNKNIIENNHIKLLLKTQKTLNTTQKTLSTLNTLVTNAIKNTYTVDNISTFEINLPKQIIYNKEFEKIKLNNIKKWEKNMLI
jgi:hypothetical protein